MSNIDRIYYTLKEATYNALCEHLSPKVASEVLHDDRTIDRILELASAVDALVEFGTEYSLAIDDLEASGKHFNDDDISRLLEDRGVSFPL